MKRFGESVEGIASVGVGASTHYPHPRIDPYTYTHYTHRWARAVQPSNTPGLVFSCTRRQASPVCICAYVYVCVCVRDGLDARCVYIMCVYAPPPRSIDQPTNQRHSRPRTAEVRRQALPALRQGVRRRRVPAGRARPGGQRRRRREGPAAPCSAASCGGGGGGEGGGGVANGRVGGGRGDEGSGGVVAVAWRGCCCWWCAHCVSVWALAPGCVCKSGCGS